MHYEAGNTLWGIRAGLVAIVVLLTGCAATLAPVKRINDFKSIAGTWKGTFTTNSGREFSNRLIIKADGTYQVKAVNRGLVKGTLKLKDGKAINSSGGTYTLHEGRVLFFSNPGGSAQFSPVR